LYAAVSVLAAIIYSIIGIVSFHDIFGTTVVSSRLDWRAHTSVYFSVCRLASFFPHDGVQCSDWAQFIGGFHLLTIHFPIALIFLAPVIEIVARSRHFPQLRPSADFILPLAVLSAFVSAFFGRFLAHSGGSSGSLVTQHM
jgi:hypothetical protein